MQVVAWIRCFLVVELECLSAGGSEKLFKCITWSLFLTFESCSKAFCCGAWKNCGDGGAPKVGICRTNGLAGLVSNDFVYTSKSSSWFG